MGKPTVDECIVFVIRDGERRLGLAEERDDGLSRMATNNRDVRLGWILLTRELLGESLRANNVQSGNAKETLGVKSTGLLQHLSGNWDGGVDRVRNDEDEGLGGVLGDTLDKVTDDACVDLEEVITGHTGLAWSLSVSMQRDRSGILLTYGEFQPG